MDPMDTLAEEDNSTSNVNVTPLIDVALVLVLVFLVTSPLSIVHGITVKRNALGKYGLSTPQESVMIHLEPRAVYISDANGNRKQIPYDEFEMVLDGVIAKSKTKNVYLKATRETPHGATVWALDLAKQHGAADISMMASERK
jgi:biopolymer transport protein ExbD